MSAKTIDPQAHTFKMTGPLDRACTKCGTRQTWIAAEWRDATRLSDERAAPCHPNGNGGYAKVRSKE